ncbi:formate/nitrite transporter family protein [Paenibacillus rhizoplanae]
MTSKSTSGKILAMWLPILTFFGQGFEHTVVNFFVIPAGMMLGANVTMADWWIWNGVPVLLGNFAGGLLFTGLLFYLSQKKAADPELLRQQSFRDAEKRDSRVHLPWRKAYEAGQHIHCRRRSG